MGQNPESVALNRPKNVIGHIFRRNRGAFHQLGDITLNTWNHRAHTFGQIGLKKRRAYATDLNTALAQLLAHSFRQSNDTGLGHIVTVHHRRQHQACHRRNIHKRTRALLFEHRCKRLTTAHHAQHVDIQNPLPIRHRRVFNRPGRRHTGVIHHNIHTAPTRDQIIPNPLQILQPANITIHIIALATRLADFLLYQSALLRIHIANANLRALTGIAQRNRPPQTTGSAGNKYSCCHSYVLMFEKQLILKPAKTVMSHKWRSPNRAGSLEACFIRTNGQSPTSVSSALGTKRLCQIKTYLYLRNSSRATVALCTSSGPSAKRNTRA